MRNILVKTLAICPYCKREFRNKNELRAIDDCSAHMRIVHPETERSFKEIDRKAAIVPGEIKLLTGGS